MLMVSTKDFNSAALETMRMSRNPTTVMTAKGEVQTREEATVFVKVTLLEDSRSSFLWEALRGSWVFFPHPTKNGKRNDCIMSNYVPFVVRGLSTRSSTTPTPTSPSSSSQDSVFDVNRYIEHPVQARSGSMSAELRENPMHKPTETENKKNEGREEVQSDLLHDLPDWLQEFREKKF